MLKCWRNHSKTVTGLLGGGAIVIGARYGFPDGGVDFDLITLVGGVLFSFGAQGVLDYLLRETAKPED